MCPDLRARVQACTPELRRAALHSGPLHPGGPGALRGRGASVFPADHRAGRHRADPGSGGAGSLWPQRVGAAGVLGGSRVHAQIAVCEGNSKAVNPALSGGCGRGYSLGFWDPRSSERAADRHYNSPAGKSQHVQGSRGHVEAEQGAVRLRFLRENPLQGRR